mmetsp:Transcript_9194/g.19626  ORF Transcript_9194/g.19626 Transcript_9194/m.19626 type:complete len:97 (-) Transcript_9194:294-584(-)
MIKRNESIFLRYIRRLRHENKPISLVALLLAAITIIFYLLHLRYIHRRQPAKNVSCPTADTKDPFTKPTNTNASASPKVQTAVKQSPINASSNLRG